MEEIKVGRPGWSQHGSAEPDSFRVLREILDKYNCELETEAHTWRVKEKKWRFSAWRWPHEVFLLPSIRVHWGRDMEELPRTIGLRFDWLVFSLSVIRYY